MQKRYLLFAFISFSLFAALPAKFDLRSVDGKNLVTKVKNQSGGTCWTHGTMAAIEGNLMMNGEWAKNNEEGQPLLAEYHLDWWNGFNEHWNPDTTESGGLTVHEGGDYRVAAAYLSRGGAVRDSDGQSYTRPPEQNGTGYHYYYPRDIEWYSAGSNNENIDTIKQAVMTYGVMGTALDWSDSFYNSSSNTFYQPNSSDESPNHSVAIVGWDDSKATDADKPGAWLIKNSWGSGWGEDGFFWISYFDKTATHHAEMGAVSFQNVERLKYKNIYYYDTHGWRDTKSDALEAFNAFVAKGNRVGNEVLRSVSFYTTEDQTEFSIEVNGAFEGGQLKNSLSITEGYKEHKGFHTVDLNWPVYLQAGQKFYVNVKLSRGGHAFDKTSNVPVLLGSRMRVTVPSSANPGESFYKKGDQWVDLTTDDSSANFCIKGLSTFE